MNALAHHHTRRAVLGRAAAAAAAIALTSCGIEQARQQTRKPIPRIGLITGPSSPSTQQLSDAFRAGVRDHGYVEGETVRLELRVPDDRPNVYDDIAAELAGIPVDVIVTPATLAALEAAARATRTIPIVTTMSQDPVASGLAASLARPGGNVTGIANTLEVVSAKRLQLVRELIPGMKRVAAISDGVTPGGRQSLKGAQDAGRELDVEVDDLVLSRESSALVPILERALARGVDALLVGAVPFWITDMRSQIATHALDRRIPLVAGQPDWAKAGSLAAFGPDQLETIRRLAYFVDRILKGTKAGDLPIEQPSKFEVILNLRTAKALSLTIAASVMTRATRVIE